MNLLFITLGLSKLSQKASTTISSFIALLLGLLIMINFNENTLFLASLLISIITLRALSKENFVKNDKKNINISKIPGVWFALSVSPAVGVSYVEISNISNGFLVQAFLSFALFLYVEHTKPSIIKKISREAKGAMSVIGSDVLSGFTAGIASALVWQGYLKVFAFLS